jgi:hypothetical protein
MCLERLSAEYLRRDDLFAKLAVEFSADRVALPLSKIDPQVKQSASHVQTFQLTCGCVTVTVHHMPHCSHQNGFWLGGVHSR